MPEVSERKEVIGEGNNLVIGDNEVGMVLEEMNEIYFGGAGGYELPFAAEIADILFSAASVMGH